MVPDDGGMNAHELSDAFPAQPEPVHQHPFRVRSAPQPPVHNGHHPATALPREYGGPRGRHWPVRLLDLCALRRALDSWRPVPRPAERRGMAHPQRACWAIPAPPALFQSRAPGGVIPRRTGSTPLEFIIDESEELVGGSRRSKCADLQQGLAQLHKVFRRHKGPPPEGVEYPVRAPWTEAPGHAASFAARSGLRYP